MKLFIVESPTKVKVIQKYLGVKKFKVIGTKGHLFNLKKEYGKDFLGINLEKFEPMMEIIKTRKPDVNKIKKAADKADEIIFATDHDREGEAISYNLSEYLGIDIKKTKRVVYNEISKKKILDSLNDIRNIDLSLVESQKARRMIDRIIGFLISFQLKKTIRSRSAGRVQSVVLKLISDKEKRIQEFIPQEHYNITIKLDNGVTIEYYSNKLVFNDEKILVEKSLEGLTKIKLEEITNKETKTRAPRPLITSRLLAQAYDKFSFSATKTSFIAQQLYEGVNKKNKPLITYIRTDSPRLSTDFLNKAKKYFTANKYENLFNKKYYNGPNNSKNKTKIQDAHEAIRQIDLFETPEKAKLYLSLDHYKIYKLIYYYTLSALSNNLKTNAKTYWWQKNNLRFNWKYTEILSSGYTYFMKKIISDKAIINNDISLKKGDISIIKKIVYKKDETKPEGRFSEASIIRDLEKIGIGRPSTYAAIISLLKKHGYINAKQKALQPTIRGMYTNNILQKHFSKIFNEQYTADLEEDLDKIANNKLDYHILTKETYEKVTKNISDVDGKIKVISGIPLKGKKCPKCKGDLLVKWSRKVKNDFIACKNYPDCRYIEIVSGFKSQAIGIKCPKCNCDFVTRKGRRNSIFIACGGFPKCRNVLKLSKEELKDIIKKLKQSKTDE